MFFWFFLGSGSPRDHQHGMVFRVAKGVMYLLFQCISKGPPKAPTSVCFAKKNLIQVLFFDLSPNFVQIPAHTQVLAKFYPDKWKIHPKNRFFFF